MGWFCSTVPSGFRSLEQPQQFLRAPLMIGTTSGTIDKALRASAFMPQTLNDRQVFLIRACFWGPSCSCSVTPGRNTDFVGFRIKSLFFANVIVPHMLLHSCRKSVLFYGPSRRLVNNVQGAWETLIDRPEHKHLVQTSEHKLHLLPT